MLPLNPGTGAALWLRSIRQDGGQDHAVRWGRVRFRRPDGQDRQGDQPARTPDRWCQGTLRTHDGRHCIRGAIMAVDGVGTLEAIVLRAINEVTGRHYRRIESFNDHPNTDHVQVVEVLARARTALAVGHLAAICARPPAPGGWGRRLVGWINGRGC